MSEQVTFTRRGLVQGAVKMLPIALVDVPFAIVLGVLARQAGLSTLEIMLMSMLVFAGASQLIAVGLWASPVPVLTIVLTTLIVNVRHLLMGAALRPWFSRLGPLKTYASAHFITDESWALAMREFKNGGRDAAFLLGGGLALFVLWVGGTGIGHLLGAGISAQDLITWGLDFVVTAVFVALAVSLWRGKADLLPWIVAAGVSFGAYLLLPGTRWYILLGGLAGSILGAFRNAD
ncbi:MAG TPA: AzlC family ABC transporter permease [Chloroflexia bacterium]|jgi:4-azaleucine resistance transporter AzlC